MCWNEVRYFAIYEKALSNLQWMSGFWLILLNNYHPFKHFLIFIKMWFHY